MDPVLIIIIIIVAIFLGGLLFLNFLMSPYFYKAMMFLFIFVSVLLVYYFLGRYLYQFTTSIFYIPPSARQNMVLWDNIWYLIFVIFILLILAVFIKSVKDNGMRWNLLLSSIGVLFILILYTIMYYIIVYNEYVGQNIFKLTIVLGIYTGIIMIIREWSMKFTAPIFTLYALLSLIYIICIFVWIFNMLIGCYSYVYI
jgi:hypothetical protein